MKDGCSQSKERDRDKVGMTILIFSSDAQNFFNLVIQF